MHDCKRNFQLKINTCFKKIFFNKLFLYVINKRLTIWLTYHREID